VFEIHLDAGYRRRVPHLEVNGGRLWLEETGSGPAVLFIHGGLGDSRLWEPQARSLADHFRTIRFDLRFYGRSESPGIAFSAVDDVIGLLDALEIERAALVGLSLGGALALDVALLHPERVWAIAHVAGGVSGVALDAYTDEQERAYEAAVEAGDIERAMDIDFDVWAPLGVNDTLRDLWRATPDMLGVPEGAVAAPRPQTADRLGEIRAPTLVVVATHDPAGLQDADRRVAREVPGARLAEVDSDHYLTLRVPEQVDELLLEFLSAAAAE
jgi:pimeloyl-ACP methyl ester carboxylesterase